MTHVPPPVPPPTAPQSAGLPPLPADPAVVNEVARLSNEGVALTQTTDSGEAEDLLRRALELAEERLGADHPSTAVCLNNLGDFLSRNGRFEEAEAVLRRAVAAEERLHGADALETATALSNLALVEEGIRDGRLGQTLSAPYEAVRREYESRVAEGVLRKKHHLDVEFDRVLRELGVRHSLDTELDQLMADAFKRKSGSWPPLM